MPKHLFTPKIPILLKRLRDHLKLDPATLPVIEQRYDFYHRTNIHLGIETLSKSSSNTYGPRESLHSNERGCLELSSIGGQLATCLIGICIAVAGTWNLSFSDSRTGNDLYALLRLERQFFGGWSQHTSRPPSQHSNERFLFDWGLCAVDIPGGDCAT